MKLIASEAETQPVSEIETITLSEDQYEMLRKLSRDLNPDTHVAFGGAHAIRTLLERIEEAQSRAAAVKRPRRS
jgi:hypothetical protein